MVREANSEGPQYERLRVALGDGNAQIASTIKESLHERGIGEVVLCDSTERLYDALDREMVDLLL